jgi:predicted ATPase
VKLEKENGSFYAIKINRNDNDDIRIANEEIKTIQTEKTLIVSKYGQVESKLVDFFKECNQSKPDLESLKLVESFKYYKFSNTIQNSAIRKAQFEARKCILEENLSNLWPFLNYLKKEYNKCYNDILNAVRFVHPNFIDLEFIMVGKEFLDVIWYEKGNQKGYVSSQLSDGTLRFICFATILLMPSLEQIQISGTPNVVIIDEIEFGLHPQAIHILAELIHKASNHKQIIIVTQSVELINKFKSDVLIIVDKITKKMPFNENGRDYETRETVFSRLTNGEVKLKKAKTDVETWLYDYKFGQLWESNIFGGNP